LDYYYPHYFYYPFARSPALAPLVVILMRTAILALFARIAIVSEVVIQMKTVRKIKAAKMEAVVV